jgi:hypothetical protein
MYIKNMFRGLQTVEATSQLHSRNSTVHKSLKGRMTVGTSIPSGYILVPAVDSRFIDMLPCRLHPPSPLQIEDVMKPSMIYRNSSSSNGNQELLLIKIYLKKVNRRKINLN